MKLIVCYYTKQEKDKEVVLDMSLTRSNRILLTVFLAVPIYFLESGNLLLLVLASLIILIILTLFDKLIIGLALFLTERSERRTELLNQLVYSWWLSFVLGFVGAFFVAIIADAFFPFFLRLSLLGLRSFYILLTGVLLGATIYLPLRQVANQLD